ncbi:MAG: methylated-DNA--[protein]-cysteine S-methyltransferase [Sphingomonas sp.]
MSERGFTLFETAIGRCIVGWAEAGLTATQLPEASRDRALARMARRMPDADEAEPPQWVRGVIGRIASHLAGARVDYADVPLDERGLGEWERAVYRAAAAIPAGETRTYGALAGSLGRPDAAQAVGQALGRNPWPIVIPCHRILAADGRTGGFSAPGGVATKLKLLEIEGALAPATLPLFASRAD